MTDQDDHELSAGEFSVWLSEMQAALRGDGESDVPCGTCTACCTAAQFIHIEPDELDTLAHIPGELLFPAPRLPRGHRLMGYDERGHCPMLIDERCSIYEHRPRTCRTYDCRVFPASGVAADEDKPLLRRQSERWQFTYRTDDDRTLHEAVRATARYLRDHRDELPGGAVPTAATPLAVLAIELHHNVLAHDDGTGRRRVIKPDVQAISVELTRRTQIR